MLNVKVEPSMKRVSKIEPAVLTHKRVVIIVTLIETTALTIRNEIRTPRRGDYG